MQLYGKNWPRDFSKRFFIGMHMPDLDQNSALQGILNHVDPKDMVGRLADTGCDTLYFYMSCHMGNCYYPTRVKYGRTHSGMNGRDLFGETAEACGKHKIALVAVYEFVHLQYLMKADLVPRDWKHYRLDQQRKIIAAGLCWNSGYGDFVLDQIREVAASYPVAGFYVDMLDYPGRDLCPACARRFRDELGREPPTLATDVTAPLFKEYKMWTFREAARYLERLRTNIHEFIPGATLLHNYHFMICEDIYEARSAVDYASTDPGIGYGYPFDSMVRATATAPVFRSLSEGKACPFDVLFDDVVLGALEIMPLEPFLGVAATALAHGGVPCPDSMWGKDGSLNPAALGLVKEVYRHVDQVKNWIGGGVSLKFAGLYLSQETEFLYANPGDKKDWERKTYMPAFFGAMMMLDQEHLLTDVLTRRQLSRLSEYAVIYLPDAVCLSDLEAQAFREYVRSGGTLVASHEASLANEWGNRKTNFQLADVFGADFTGATADSYMAFQMNVLQPDDFPFAPWENPCVTVRENESGLIVRCRAGAREVASLHERYRASTVPGELPAIRNAFMVEKPLGPAIVENRFGRGRCIYVAVRAFGAYVVSQVPEIRKLLARWLIREAVALAPVNLDAPGCVKMTARERPSEARWIIHLVNIQSIPGDSYFNPARSIGLPMTDYLIPVTDLKITLRPGQRTVKRVQAIVADVELKWEAAAAGSYVVTLPRLHAHEVVVVEFAAPWPDRPERFSDRDPIKMIHCPRGEPEVIGEKKIPRMDDGWNGLGEGH